jgi:hypothetical protein
MKKSVLFICFSLLFATIYSQDKVSNESIDSKNAIGIYSNIGICEITGHQYHTNIVNAHGQEVFIYGLKYIRSVSPKLKIEYGISYAKYTVVDLFTGDLSSYFEGREYLILISVPIIFKYYLPKNYYLSGGTMLDLVPWRNNWIFTESQNGIGFCIGAGKEIMIKRFLLYVEPNLDLHALIPFSGYLSQQKFFVPGLKIGINYKLN